MRQAGVPGEPVRFGARDAEGSAGMTEFQYKVVESDYRRYVGKCSKFGNGCTWLIRQSLRQRKGIWEVKRYNGPHTCLASSMSSNHRSLDYHVISAFIMPTVRADASVSIKVLLNATASHYGFRPTYRRVWMAKQKAVAVIYGDWDESYNELPRWVLGVQVTMPGSIAVFRTSPVRVGGQLDESQAYFYRLFWSFPPCIEAFRHCKSLVSIDGTHLYGKHNGIKAALEAPDGGWLPPAAYRAFYIRHVAANFAITFNGKDARRLLMNAAYAKTEVEFDYWFDILRSEDPAMCDWKNRIEYSLWT
ncbi:uncharacterized protein [Arachis hypogaea]|uniref:uncharacterized protein n=1 Tax=Arachis hypogaea TaxID=3818 RepID=UPI003B2277E5